MTEYFNFISCLCNYTVINDCSPEGGNPCANNGVCIDLVGGYSCVCPDSFIGSKCEVESNKIIILCTIIVM